MNLFCSITSRKSITTVIIFILNISYSYQSCVSLFDSCEYDCDCCGNDINKGIRCELRNQDLGKRCYESQFVGQSCNISSQCNSQNCVNNICQPLLRSPAANPIPFCPLVGDSSYITAPVNGLLPICACPKRPTQVQDASYAMDDNLSTDYVNYNSHTYSGFIVETTSNAPLRKIVLCTSNANPENDPMCFRLEGKCEHDDNFTLLQEGMIPFARDLRQSCTTIAVERGRESYSQYKILFGCRRGGYDDSCQRDSRFHKFRRQIRNRKLDAMCTGDYPVILSEVRLLGKCNEGSLFTSPTTPTEAPTSTEPPTSPPTNALTSSLGTIELKKGNLIGIIKDPPNEYILSFEITPYSTSSVHQGILRFANVFAHTNMVTYGDRAVLFHFPPNSYDVGFRYADKSVVDPYRPIHNAFVKPNQENKVKVVVVGDTVSLYVNDALIETNTYLLSNRPPFEQLYVFASDRIYSAADAIISNLLFTTVSDERTDLISPASYFIGCFVDMPDRDLPFSNGQVSSSEACKNKCLSKGYRFMGRQYLNQCWCGNSYGKHGDASSCGNGCQEGSGYFGSYTNCVYDLSVFSQ